MREILFRGKRTDNGEWVYGDLVRNYFKVGDTCICVQSECGFYSVDPETVGQYTGLTANGKKIFEGDIVKIDKSHIGKIVFNERTCGFECWFSVIVGGYGEKATCKRNLAQLGCIEIIGNIHDNPELLERGCDNG